MAGGGIFSPGLQLQYNFIDVTPGSAQRQIIDALNAIDGLSVVFEPQKDTDSDGMWDPFEQLIIDADSGDAITTLADVLPGDDFDGDGWTNLEEFRDRTDPTDPADFSIIVTIPDANLEQAIRDALDKPTGDITDADLESLRYLLARDAIADITGLEMAVNLKILRLNLNQITDLSPLSGLTSLTRLELSANRISDISALSGLTNLTELELGGNQISDISALSGLTSLTKLYLSNNKISDISALADLTNLRGDRLYRPGLRLQYNFIDVTPGSEQRQIIDALNAIDGLRVEFEPQYLDIFLGQAIDGFPGWRASPWYLNYNVDFWPWIYHDEHGWQFVDSGSTEEVIFVWDFGIGEWLFLNENTYRWMFLFGDNSGWIFTFEINTPNWRFFQRFNDDSVFIFRDQGIAKSPGVLEDLPAPPDSLGVVRNPKYRPSDELIDDLQRRRAQAELNQSGHIPDQYVVMFHKEFFPYAVPSTSEFRAEAVSFDGETLTTVARRIVEEAGGDLYYAYSHAIIGFSARLTPGQVAAIARHPMVKLVGPEHILYPELNI